MTIDFEIIEKENIGTLKFHIVKLEDVIAIKERKNELERALALGNLEHSKIQIYFEDDRSKNGRNHSLGINGFKCRFKKGVESQLIEF
jgi:hypothetical protein